ncbi:hypothetical protein BJY04DRAFT_222865 [Aspergillus karnatakaensis]|uniref:uncharacterized protein n=1 Tax=Aspergillus karnatakaensis TaxID=1810916 RepID=UPI003CCE0A85
MEPIDADKATKEPAVSGLIDVRDKEQKTDQIVASQIGLSADLANEFKAVLDKEAGIELPEQDSVSDNERTRAEIEAVMNEIDKEASLGDTGHERDPKIDALMLQLAIKGKHSQLQVKDGHLQVANDMSDGRVGPVSKEEGSAGARGGVEVGEEL